MGMGITSVGCCNCGDGGHSVCVNYQMTCTPLGTSPQICGVILPRCTITVDGSDGSSQSATAPSSLSFTEDGQVGGNVCFAVQEGICYTVSVSCLGNPPLGTMPTWSTPTSYSFCFPEVPVLRFIGILEPFPNCECSCGSPCYEFTSDSDCDCGIFQNATLNYVEGSGGLWRSGLMTTTCQTPDWACHGPQQALCLSPANFYYELYCCSGTYQLYTVFPDADTYEGYCIFCNGGATFSLLPGNNCVFSAGDVYGNGQWESVAGVGSGFVSPSCLGGWPGVQVQTPHLTLSPCGSYGPPLPSSRDLPDIIPTYRVDHSPPPPSRKRRAWKEN